MTGQEALDAMRALEAENRLARDHERDHVAADDVLCALLRSLGFNALVDSYDKVGKWYA